MKDHFYEVRLASVECGKEILKLASKQELPRTRSQLLALLGAAAATGHMLGFVYAQSLGREE